MLGGIIEDLDGVESTVPVTKGLNLLPIATRFASTKRTTQVRARTEPNSFFGSDLVEFYGYEIHIGRVTAFAGARSLFTITRRNGEKCDSPDGAVSADGVVVGTMMHGIFENTPLRSAMLSMLYQRKGLDPRKRVNLVASREAEYHRLARAVREHIDLEAIRNIAGLP